VKIFISLLLICISIFAEQDSTKELSFFDEKDGSLDLSEYMSQAYGFVPVPILITEPSVGYGGGLALVYLHDTLMGTKSESGRRIPPSVSGIMLAATENGTQIGGAFHFGYWLEDTLRTTTYIGNPDVYIDLYTNRTAFEMHMKGMFLYQDVKLRVKESNFFIGGSYLTTSSDVSFDFPSFEQDFGKKVNIASVGFIAEYDSRDNQMSPNEGMLITTKGFFYDKSVGSDYKLERYKIKGLFYNKIDEKINLDFSFLGETVTGNKSEIPPYMYPFVIMRGLPMMKYQGENITQIEAQISYQFTPRWKGVAFGGIGKTFGEQIASPHIDFTDAKEIYAGGVGFRYLLSRKFGLRVGLDVAQSKEDKAFYIQFGTAWNGF